jgi:hypothetical protein
MLDKPREDYMMNGDLLAPKETLLSLKETLLAGR